MEKVLVGLIKGRHAMPVNQFIFNETIENVHDYDSMARTILEFLAKEIGIVNKYAPALNQYDYTDVLCLQGAKELVVYVTGLTCVTAELIRCCALNGVNLTLMHYDNATQNYVAQRIFDL